MHIPLAFWYQLNILESIVTLAEFHTGTLWDKMYPGGKKTQLDFFSSRCCNIYCLQIIPKFRYFGRFLTSPYSFHPVSPKFPPSIPLVCGNFPPSTNPLFHAHNTRSFVHFKGCGSTTNTFVYVPQYLYITGRHLEWNIAIWAKWGAPKSCFGIKISPYSKYWWIVWYIITWNHATNSEIHFPNYEIYWYQYFTVPWNSMELAGKFHGIPWNFSRSWGKFHGIP